MALRKDDLLLNVVDQYTGEQFTTKDVTTWWDGSAMDDSKVDNVIYYKTEQGYAKREFSTPINIEWFGAKGDDITDNTLAFQTCFSAVRNGVVYIPPGFYQINDTITILNGANLVIDGGGMVSGGNLDPGGPSGIAHIKYVNSTAAGTAAFNFLGNNTRIQIKNITLSCPVSNPNVDGMHFDHFRLGIMENVAINRFRHNIDITGFWYWATFSHCQFKLASEASFFSTEVGNMTSFYSCNFHENAIGLRIDNGGVGINFIGCWWQNNPERDLYVTNTQLLNFTDCYFESSGDAVQPVRSCLQVDTYLRSTGIAVKVNFDNCTLLPAAGSEPVHFVYSDGGTASRGDTFISFKGCRLSDFRQDAIDPAYMVYVLSNPDKINLSFTENSYSRRNTDSGNRSWFDTNVDKSLLHGYTSLNCMIADGNSALSTDKRGRFVTNKTVTNEITLSRPTDAPGTELNRPRILTETGDPSGIFEGGEGSIFLRQGVSNERATLYIKTAGGTGGWRVFRPANITDINDANSINAGADFIPFSNSSGSTGFPNVSGSGIYVHGTSEISNGGGWKLWKSNDPANTNLYLQVMTAPGVWGSFSPILTGEILSESALLDFPSTPAQTSSDESIVVTGAAVGDVVSLGIPASAMVPNVSYTAYVSAADTVAVRLNNYSASAVDPIGDVFEVKVFKL